MRVASVQDGFINVEDIKKIDVIESDIEKYRLCIGDLLLTEGGDPVAIDFKPITLLFGPNSVGKSTIFQALHYAHEIFERGNLTQTPLSSGARGLINGGASI